MFLGRTCSRSSIRRASALRTGWRPSWSSWRTGHLCFSPGICSLLDRMAILAHVLNTRPGQKLDKSPLRLVAPTHPDSYNTCREAVLCPPDCSTRRSTRPIAPPGGSGISSPSCESRPTSTRARSPGSTRSTWTSAGSTRPARPSTSG